MRRDRSTASLLVAGACALAACQDAAAVREFGPPRELPAASSSQAGVTEVRWNASSAERFGFAPSRATAGSARAASFAWDTPAGWVELAPTALRQANFRVAGDERAECYLTLLAGDAGGLAANANRWRAQMSAPPLGPSELAALERGQLLGGEAVTLDVAGTWTGMSGATRADGYRLVGLLRIDSGGSAFLKMTGPADVLAGQIEAFRSLARSFRRADPVAAAHGASAGPSPSAPAPRASELTWRVPEGWRVAPEKPTRLIGFFVGADESAECTLTLLPGAAGGAQANVNRWRAQLGREPISADALEALPRVPMLGGALLVEFDGQRDAPLGGAAAGETSGAREPAAMLATIGAAGDRSVFVKLVGPPALVAAERARFLEFCASLALPEGG